MKLFSRVNIFIFNIMMFFMIDANARSAKSVAKRVTRDVKDLSVEILFIGLLIVGALFAMGSRVASEKAVGWMKGVFLVFGGATAISLVKGWF